MQEKNMFWKLRQKITAVDITFQMSEQRGY